MKKIIIGSLLSIALIFFFIGGVDFDKVLEILGNSNYLYLALAALTLSIIPFARSLRWRVILSPIVKMNRKELIPLDSVGYMSNMVLPRVGDVLRPYLVSNKMNIPFSSVLATTIVEKIFDLIIIMVMIVIILSSLSLPSWVSSIGYSLIASIIILSVLIAFLYVKPERGYKLLNWLIRRFSQKTQDKINRVIHSFVDGLKIITKPKDMLVIFLFSLFLWGLSVFAIYNLFTSLSLDLSPAVALVVLTFVMLGVSLPSAPANLLTFHAACILALELFAISRDEAWAFAFVYHGLFTAVAFIFGILFIFFIDFSFVELKNKLRFLLSKKPSHG